MTLPITSLYAAALALILLGVGWNFLYVGGTTMLTYTYTPEERFRAQRNGPRRRSRSVDPENACDSVLASNFRAPTSLPKSKNVWKKAG